MKEHLDGAHSIVKKAIDKGVTVVNGSDMYLFTRQRQGQMAQGSIEVIYEATKKPGDALQAATRQAAIACGVGHYTGVIREKMMADIVAFEGDMEKDFPGCLQKVKFVMKEGKIYVQ